MKRILVIGFLLSACGWALAGPISPTDAASHIGMSVTVEGVVSDVHVARSATFINMGGSYPVNAFTGVIFSDDVAVVGDVSGLAGKTIDMTGTIQLYRGKPEVVLKSASQIRVH